MLKNLWQELDHHWCIEIRCPEDATILKNYIKKDWVYEFLVGLNMKFDQVRVQILSKKLQILNETTSIIPTKESRSVMLEPQNWEYLTMVANKGSDQKTNIANHKRVDRSRVPNRDYRNNLWCTSCQKARHTWEWGDSEGQKKDNGQAHLSFVQPVEERSLEQGRFNKEENEKLRNLLWTLEKPSSPCSLTLSNKFPISIVWKVSNETFVNS